MGNSNSSKSRKSDPPTMQKSASAQSPQSCVKSTSPSSEKRLSLPQSNTTLAETPPLSEDNSPTRNWCSEASNTNGDDVKVIARAQAASVANETNTNKTHELRKDVKRTGSEPIPYKNKTKKKLRDRFKPKFKNYSSNESSTSANSNNSKKKDKKSKKMAKKRLSQLHEKQLDNLIDFQATSNSNDSKAFDSEQNTSKRNKKNKNSKKTINTNNNAKKISKTSNKKTKSKTNTKRSKKMSKNVINANTNDSNANGSNSSINVNANDSSSRLSTPRESNLLPKDNTKLTTQNSDKSSKVSFGRPNLMQQDSATGISIEYAESTNVVTRERGISVPKPMSRQHSMESVTYSRTGYDPVIRVKNGELPPLQTPAIMGGTSIAYYSYIKDDSAPPPTAAMMHSGGANISNWAWAGPRGLPSKKYASMTHVAPMVCYLCCLFVCLFVCLCAVYVLCFLFVS